MHDRYVIGYSGIDSSRALFFEQHPNAHPRLSGLSQGADSAAALIKNGRVMAAMSEERITGEKGTGAFPAHSIRELLKDANLTISDIDAIAHGFMYDSSHFPSDVVPLTDRKRTVYGPDAQRRLWRHHFGPHAADLYSPVAHHRAHARMGHSMSGGEDGAIIVMDGRGETSSTSIFHAKDQRLHLRGQVSATHSLGVFYSIVTYHLGFKPGEDEYKVMALASFGDPGRFRKMFAEYVRLHDLGSYSIPLLAREKSWIDRELHLAALMQLADEVAPPRAPGADMEPIYADIAAALQERFEQAVVHVGRWTRDLTGAPRVTLTGGAAMNCVAMTKLIESGIFDEVAVPPAAGDEGTAVGAALDMFEQQSASGNSTIPDWGSRYSDSELEMCFPPDDWQCVTYSDIQTTCLEAARLLANGEIVGWFQGGMEFGARSLGFRSILADPRTADMRDKVNRVVKQRESFRPFAPAIVEECASSYFDIDPSRASWYRYMTLIARPRIEVAGELGAVTHVDGTSRVQTVPESGNPRFWLLLREFEKLAGIPVLLNTSFNVNGQPIVRTPTEALATADRAGLDAVVLGCTLYKRNWSQNEAI